MKWYYYVLLTGFLSFFYTLLAPLLGQWSTILLVLISILIIYIGCQKSIWNVILALTGYLIATFSNHLITIPLSIMGISITDIYVNYYTPFLASVIVVTFSLLFLTRKFLSCSKLFLLQKSPRKQQYMILAQLLLYVCLLTVNFTYGEVVGYPNDVLTFNGLVITLLTLFTLILFALQYHILHDNYKLKLQQKEQEILTDYTKQIEGFYEDFRIFRHDYKNILSTLSFFIAQKDWLQLDNAIEVASLTKEKKLSIAVIITEGSVILSFVNSCPPIDTPISKLFKKGYTTKGNHEGLGLHTVRKLTDSLENISYSVQFDGLFHQTIEIREITNV